METKPISYSLSIRLCEEVMLVVPGWKGFASGVHVAFTARKGKTNEREDKLRKCPDNNQKSLLKGLRLRLMNTNLQTPPLLYFNPRLPATSSTILTVVPTAADSNLFEPARIQCILQPSNKYEKTKAKSYFQLMLKRTKAVYEIFIESDCLIIC